MCVISCGADNYPRTVVSAKNLATGDIIEKSVTCYTKTDRYMKWLGRRLAVSKLISSLSDDKNQRREMWKDYFNSIKSDPHRDEFFDAYVKDYFLPETA